MYRPIALVILVALGAVASIWSVRVTESSGAKLIDIYDVSTGEVEKVKAITRADAEWKRILTSEQYQVMRRKGTERPSDTSCSLPAKGEKGIYQCAGCGTDLFEAERKFESDTGWPSFWDPVSKLNVRYVQDRSHGMQRTEVACARCGSHLGHVFNDGPPPTGKRFCINSVALKLTALKPQTRSEKTTFAAGCFWGAESVFRELLGKGVIKTRTGYTGGDFPSPTYEDVSSHETGHYEAVEVTFDPTKVSYRQLLDLFWKNHNPYRSDGQGPDVGSQYRAAIFYHTPEQRKAAEESKLAVKERKPDGKKIVTGILPAKTFYPAEKYHQQYYEKRNISPACRAY